MMLLNTLVLFGLGAVIGSFLNVLILRLPKEETIGGRSHCMHCGHVLSAIELVPILSFLALRGKCANCKKRISPRYILIESATGLLFSLSYLILGAHSGVEWFLLARNLFVICVMLVVFMVDLEHFLILDKVVIPASAAVLVMNIISDLVFKRSFLDSWFWLGIIGALTLSLFFGSLYYFSDGRWIGFGDVKLTLLLGLALPFPAVMVAAFAAFFIGSIVGVILMVIGGRSFSSKVPLGTFLAVGSLIAIWWGSPVLNWYLKVLGWQ